ncbi:hypothetical protein [Nostoc sp. WHI]|uniref:hypothetical protein n=1 Tax=Nostoc sp. WHI TaxID=2650611 RepID=UPI0018C79EAD|nr:hypothetical protein [Nostoc sp. WHI]MBG1265522.1 hypothetical protein [Nostoc sp. WHI]
MTYISGGVTRKRQSNKRPHAPRHHNPVKRFKNSLQPWREGGNSKPKRVPLTGLIVIIINGLKIRSENVRAILAKTRDVSKLETFHTAPELTTIATITVFRGVFGTEIFIGCVRRIIRDKALISGFVAVWVLA